MADVDTAFHKKFRPVDSLFVEQTVWLLARKLLRNKKRDGINTYTSARNCGIGRAACGWSRQQVSGRLGAARRQGGGRGTAGKRRCVIGSVRCKNKGLGSMFDRLIPTTLVGSYPQPDWLVDKKILLGSGPPRVRMRDVWRPEPDLLEQAQDDAALVVLHDQERVDIDIVCDGEVRRESYFNHFANALGGIDIDNPGVEIGRAHV